MPETGRWILPLAFVVPDSSGDAHVPDSVGRIRATAYTSATIASKRDLRAHLHQPGRHRANHLSKPPTADITVNCLRPEELRVVENVEAFEAKLQGFRFGQPQVF